jgi:uncharacterized protein with beta-barrel porin domain
MNVESETTTQLTSEIGVEYRAQFATQSALISPALSLGWAHQHLDDTSKQTSQFASASSAVVSSEGPKQDRDSAQIGADLSVSNLSATSTLYAGYDGSIAQDHQDHRFTAGYRWNW